MSRSCMELLKCVKSGGMLSENRRWLANSRSPSRYSVITGSKMHWERLMSSKFLYSHWLGFSSRVPSISFCNHSKKLPRCLTSTSHWCAKFCWRSFLKIFWLVTNGQINLNCWSVWTKLWILNSRWSVRVCNKLSKLPPSEAWLHNKASKHSLKEK